MQQDKHSIRKHQDSSGSKLDNEHTEVDTKGITDEDVETTTGEDRDTASGDTADEVEEEDERTRTSFGYAGAYARSDYLDRYEQEEMEWAERPPE